MEGRLYRGVILWSDNWGSVFLVRLYPGLWASWMHLSSFLLPSVGQDGQSVLKVAIALSRVEVCSWLESGTSLLQVDQLWLISFSWGPASLRRAQCADVFQNVSFSLPISASFLLLPVRTWSSSCWGWREAYWSLPSPWLGPLQF